MNQLENTMSDKVIHSTDSMFEHEVLKSEIPVLVDFWAEWCGPCRMISPLLDSIAEEYEGRLLIVKIDVDSNNEIPQRYGVRGIPTLVMFKDGASVGDKVGALSKAQLVQFIEEHL